MEFSLQDRTCSLSVGEFAGFTLGPRGSDQGGPAGVWRAQLGQHWHTQLRQRVETETGTRAAFEVPLTLAWIHRGWNLTFTGRIDQIVTTAKATIVREIKTVTGPLPAPEAVLRADYADYFIQAVTYLTLLRAASPGAEDPANDGEGRHAWPATGDLRLSTGGTLQAELVFVEIGTGITQTVVLAAADEASFRTQLERLTEFLHLRLRARERLRHLRFQPAFAVLRPGQETIQAELLAASGSVASPESKVQGGSFPPSTFDLRPSTVLLFEAPTGYGKTGVLLEFALGRLREGRFSRLLYLTGKSTGQLQVMRTLAAMTASAGAVECPKSQVDGMNRAPSTCDLRPSPGGATAVAAWQVRPKAEHCVNEVFHCVRDVCPFLADVETRWSHSGLARLYLRENEPRDLEALRAAGRDARICPYEITRAALPFNDVWIGDYNYVFAPDSRGVFYERLGFSPAETLLIIDEAHNLPARVADAWSHVVRAGDAEAVLADLHHVRPPSSLLLAWEHWARLLAGLRHADSLEPTIENDIRDAVGQLASIIAVTPLDYAALGPHVSEQLWQTLALRDWLAGDFSLPANPKSEIGNQPSVVPTLLWCPQAGELHFTCLEAAALIGRILRTYGGVIFASATLQPAEAFAASCGLEAPAGRSLRAPSTGAGPRACRGAGDKSPLASKLAPALPPVERLGSLSKRQTRKLYRDLTSGAVLLQVEEARDAARPRLLQARAPWRESAYAVGVDTRVDTTFHHRAQHYATTAATVAALHRAARSPPASGFPPPASPAARAVAVFFPSYAYAGHIIEALETAGAPLRVALQPRSADLATQTAWVEESLALADALFLVLGSSFAESIDLLGGRVTHAMVVAPALPEVNAIQRTRLADAERAGIGRDAAFRRVYQIPGMQKVNQALGRLVRAPGQRARVLLHCRRFAEPSYAALLAPEYQNGILISTDEDFAGWLRESASAEASSSRSEHHGNVEGGPLPRLRSGP
jgi:DNA excision repair protein ERCC-2